MPPSRRPAHMFIFLLHERSKALFHSHTLPTRAEAYPLLYSVQLTNVLSNDIHCVMLGVNQILAGAHGQLAVAAAVSDAQCR